MLKYIWCIAKWLNRSENSKDQNAKIVLLINSFILSIFILFKSPQKYFVLQLSVRCYIKLNGRPYIYVCNHEIIHWKFVYAKKRNKLYI